MRQERPRIGALHALANAIPTTDDAFARVWPEAEVAHLLDGSLYLDRNAGTIDDAETGARIDRLIRYAASTGAQAIIVTGSFFGEFARASRSSVDIPVATSFDGIIERALGLAVDHPLHILSTAPASAPFLAEALRAEAENQSVAVDMTTAHVPGAMDGLLGGNPEQHDDLLLEAVRATPAGAVVLFAQFSMERTLPAADAAREAPVIGPASEGVRRLRHLVTGR